MVSINNKTFIELACSVRNGEILVSFFFLHVYGKKLNQYFPRTELTVAE